MFQTVTRQKDILKLTDLYETNRHSESISFQPKYQLSPDHLEFGKHVQQKQDYCLEKDNLNNLKIKDKTKIETEKIVTHLLFDDLNNSVSFFRIIPHQFNLS